MMTTEQLPTQLETALGGMLQDIGKFMQRAHGALRHMDERVRERESVILPVYQGRYSHKHVLWTEAFFQWMEDEGLSFPVGINRSQVRNMAVFHHSPDAFGALGWLAAEADRLSSGMDRKQRDETQENEAEHKGWNAFIKTALLSPFGPIDLGRGQGPECRLALEELIPDQRLLPLVKLDTADYQNRYQALWQQFTAEFRTLCQEIHNPELFCDGLLSLSERFTWAIPSSTVDLPDISLHDHNRTVAAIAACLHAWHSQQGTLWDETAIKDREQPKFRLLAGDLSGIQSTLFSLASQQVKGVNKILRARSFMMGMLMEATASHCRAAFEIPVFNLLQNAGGRFVLLVPDSVDSRNIVVRLQEEIDGWMQARYLGELNLNFALSEPFAGADFIPPRFQRVQDGLNRRLEEAKITPLHGKATGIHRVDYEHGICSACDKRPATVLEAGDDGDIWRCQVCDTEHRLGRYLPRVRALAWYRGKPRQRGAITDFFGDLWLELIVEDDIRAKAQSDLQAGFRIYRGNDTIIGPWALRFLANHVPVLGDNDSYDPTMLSEEANQLQPGDAKTFEHLAFDARERDVEGGHIGKPFLAVLKADVDNLGFLFGYGLRHPETQQDRNTISRSAALSRMMDLFFTGYLQTHIRRHHPNTYTVYAGGDDLLMLGPWYATIQLAQELNQEFRRYTADNPNITLSAGLELTQANYPLNRSVWAAEKRLERVKNTQQKDGVCLIDDQVLLWEELPKLLAQADTLNGWLRDKLVSTALIYKVLYFAEQRRLAEGGGEVPMDCVDWRARWAYHLARNVRNNSRINEQHKADMSAVLNELLGLDQKIQVQHKWSLTPRIPVSIALYRNRK
jgi:CRISPR-associated protein Csm1